MAADAAMQEYYNRRAAEYERIYAKPERREELEWLRREVSATLGGRTVLELACGTGYWTAVAAEVARGIRASDASAETLEIARGKRLGEHVSFAPGDAYAPAAAPDCDAGMAGFWWSHVPRLRLPVFLEAFHRAVAPGAQMLFFDNVFAVGSSTPISRRDANGDTWQTRTLADGSRHEVLKNFPDEEQLRDTIGGLAADSRVIFGRYYWLMTYRVV